jgi:hypothetical protein
MELAFIRLPIPLPIMDISKDRRRVPRYRALNGSLLAFVCPRQEEMHGDGALIDVSKGGCRISSKMPLNVSDYYRLILQPVGGQQVTIETAVVCWHSNSVYGFKFITVEQDQEELLHQNLVQLRCSV